MGDQNGDTVHEIAKYYIWLLSYLPTTENSGCKLSNIERKPGEYKATGNQRGFTNSGVGQDAGVFNHHYPCSATPIAPASYDSYKDFETSRQALGNNAMEHVRFEQSLQTFVFLEICLVCDMSVAAVQCQRWQYSIYPLDVTAFDAAVGTFFREQNSGVYYKGSSTQPGFLYISWHDKKLNPSWR